MEVTPQSFQPAHIPEWPHCVSRGHLQLNLEVPLSSLVSHLCHSPQSPILSLLLSAISPLFGQEQGSSWMASSLTSLSLITECCYAGHVDGLGHCSRVSLWVKFNACHISVQAFIVYFSFPLIVPSVIFLTDLHSALSLQKHLWH